MEFHKTVVLQIADTVDELVTRIYYSLATPAGEPLNKKNLTENVVRFVKEELRKELFNFSNTLGRSYKGTDPTLITTNNISILAKRLGVDVDPLMEVLDCCQGIGNLLMYMLDLVDHNRYAVFVPLRSETNNISIIYHVITDVRIQLWEDHKDELPLPF